jgi:hypothetical protein
VKHFIYTVDIATIHPLTDSEEYDLIMRFDSVLASFPKEFEDWKIHTHREDRPL